MLPSQGFGKTSAVAVAEGDLHAARHDCCLRGKLLAGMTGGGLVKPDADGDYPVRYRSALYYVRLVGDSHVDVQVFAVAVDGVDPSPELLAAVNEINTQVRFVRIFHVQGLWGFRTRARTLTWSSTRPAHIRL